MKTRIALVLLMFIVMSCGKDLVTIEKSCQMIMSDADCSVLTKATDAQASAFEIVKAGYVKFEENEYKLDITLEEALANGYLREGYDLLANQLSVANQYLADMIYLWENDPNVNDYVLEDCTYVMNNGENETGYITKSTVEMPRGKLTAYETGVPAVSGHIYAPLEMKGVTGYCFSPVAQTPVHIVVTNYFGSVRSRSRLMNGEISVEIAASATYGTIQYTTTDSYGGTFTWQGYSQL